MPFQLQSILNAEKRLVNVLHPASGIIQLLVEHLPALTPEQQDQANASIQFIEDQLQTARMNIAAHFQSLIDAQGAEIVAIHTPTPAPVEETPAEEPKAE